MNKKILFSVILFISQINLQAQNPFLDTTFAGTAKGHKVFSNVEGGARAVAVDGQGRIFMVGSKESRSGINDTLFVMRLKPDGMKDYPFGGVDTIAYVTDTTSIVPTCLILQPDGKILIGGNRAHNNDGTSMMVIRLNADGTRDRNFGNDGLWINDAKPNHYVDEVSNIALQSNGKIIVAGTSYDSGHGFRNISVLCLNANGFQDTQFNSFLSWSKFDENTSGLDLHKDTIIVGADYVNGQFYYYTVLKLLPNGNPYTNGVWSNGRVDISSVDAINPAIGDVAIQADGEIFMGGSDYYGFKLTKLSGNGTIHSSNSFAAGYYPFLSDIVLDEQGGIILSGYNYNFYYELIKLRENKGIEYDSTFGMYGKVEIPTNSLISYQAALSKDKKLLVVGAENSPASPSILKVHLGTVMHIVGNDYVLPNSSYFYRVEVPPVWAGYTYTCTHSDPTVVFLSGNVGPSVEVFFRESSDTTGILSCSTDRLPGMVVKKEITINNSPTNAGELDKVDCPASVNSCSAGFIDYFKFNLIRNDSSGCSSNGYTDYTLSNMIDTLIVGGVYSATFRVDDPGVYVGIWIDYNNDGIFNTSDEFVAEQYNENPGYIQIQNIILKNEAGYFGPKRMRVRSRSNGGFTSGESCQSAEDIGETEDYLVVLVKQDDLSAPQIITPNDDGKNDFFVIRGVKPDTKNTLTVFDRLGQVMFTAEDYENNWNGMESGGEKLIPGTYYYLFTNDGESIRGFLEIRY